MSLSWMAAQVEPLLALDLDYLLTRQDRRDEWAMGRLYNPAAGPIWSALPRENRRPFTKAPQEDAHEALHASVADRADKAAMPKPGPYLLPAALGAGRKTELLELEARLRWEAAVAIAESAQPADGFLAKLRRELDRLL